MRFKMSIIDPEDAEIRLNVGSGDNTIAKYRHHGMCITKDAVSAKDIPFSAVVHLFGYALNEELYKEEDALHNKWPRNNQIIKTIKKEVDRIINEHTKSPNRKPSDIPGIENYILHAAKDDDGDSVMQSPLPKIRSEHKFNKNSMKNNEKSDDKDEKKNGEESSTGIEIQPDEFDTVILDQQGTLFPEDPKHYQKSGAPVKNEISAGTIKSFADGTKAGLYHVVVYPTKTDIDNVYISFNKGYDSIEELKDKDIKESFRIKRFVVKDGMLNRKMSIYKMTQGETGKNQGNATYVLGPIAKNASNVVLFDVEIENPHRFTTFCCTLVSDNLEGYEVI